MSLKANVAVSEVCAKGEGKSFQDKIDACRHINVLTLWSVFECILQLKFGSKTCSSVIVNFHSGLRYKYVNLQLKV